MSDKKSEKKLLLGKLVEEIKEEYSINLTRVSEIVGCSSSTLKNMTKAYRKSGKYEFKGRMWSDPRIKIWYWILGEKVTIDSFCEEVSKRMQTETETGTETEKYDTTKLKKELKKDHKFNKLTEEFRHEMCKLYEDLKLHNIIKDNKTISEDEEKKALKNIEQKFPSVIEEYRLKHENKEFSNVQEQVESGNEKINNVMEVELSSEEEIELETELSSEEEIELETELPSEEEIELETELPSEEEIKPEDELPSEEEIKPEAELPSEEEIKPEDELPPEREIKPEAELPSEGEIEPEDELPSEEEIKPEAELPSEGEIEPEDELPPEREIKPEAELPSEGEIKPEDELPSEEEIEPEDELPSEEKMKPEDELLQEKDATSGEMLTEGISFIEKINNPLVEMNYKELEKIGEDFFDLFKGYSKGKKKNLKKAIKYLKKSAEAGNAKALYELGNAYKNGNEVDVDLEKAIDCYEKASKLCHPKALYELGVIYETGEGRPKNLEKAKKYYYEAAKLKCADALFRISKDYYEKKCLDENSFGGFWLYEIAKNNGSEYFDIRYENIELNSCFLKKKGNKSIDFNFEKYNLFKERGKELVKEYRNKNGWDLSFDLSDSDKMFIELLSVWL